MSIFDDGYHQAILDAARQPIDNRPLDCWKTFAPAMTPPARRLEHSERQNKETTSSATIIHLKPHISVILRRSNRCTPKKTRRCLSIRSARGSSLISFERSNGTEP